MAKDATQKALPPILRKSMESGLVLPGAVGENRSPDTSVLESINMHFDAIGSAKLRKGITALGGQLPGGQILGMHYHVDTVNTPANTRMIVVNTNVVSYFSAGNWIAIRSGLAGTGKARFSTYLNFAFMVNGVDATAIWDGTAAGSFVTTGNASGAPIGTLIENFRSRMWISGNPTYPSRVYYSSVPSAAATPVITWNTDAVTGQWIDISPSDGDSMTGLQRYRNTMLCFKTNHLYRLFDIGQVDPDPYYAVGTSSMESVVETKVGVFFHHATGIFQYNIYGLVQEVSRPIIDIIKAVPTSAYPNVVGWIEQDGDHVCWYLGDVTVNGTTYTKLVIRFTISTQVWTHYQYGVAITAALRRQPLYTDGTTQFSVTGDDGGNVYEMNTGVNDNGKPIPYSLIHRWDQIDNLLSTRKSCQVGNFLHIGGSESSVAYQTEVNDPDALNDWTKKVGQLKTINTGFNSMNIKGRKIRFRIFGQSSGQPFTYNGYELLDVLNEFIQFT